MTLPLALVLYERLLPATQLVNRLQDLKYRVHTLNEPAQLVASAEQVKPMVVLADLHVASEKVCDAIVQLRQNVKTSHLPVIAFGAEGNPGLEERARASGVTLIASEAALSAHLPQLLDQALQID